MSGLPLLAALESKQDLNGQHFVLTTSEEHQAAALALCEQAQRRVEIFSFDLDNRVYDDAQLIRMLERLTLAHQSSRIRILVKDSNRAVKSGHRIIEFSRRLSSFVEIRQRHSDYAERNEDFLLVDDSGLLERRHPERYEGTVYFSAPPEVRAKRAFFDEVWERSDADSEMRRLHL